MRRAALGALLAGATLPGAAWAHGENPRVTAILFPAPLKGGPLLVTDTQGVFGYFGDEPRWLCEDAVAPSAAFVGVAATSAPGGWVVASQAGVYLSTDDACSFAPAAGLPGGLVPAALSGHPQRPDELVVAAGEGSAAAPFGVSRSLDAGRTFAAPDLTADTPWHSLLRDPAAPERLYLSGGAGAYRSDDAGATWAPIEVALPDETIAPGAVYFLSVRPGAGEVWAAVQRVPDTLLLRSTDAGETWHRATCLPDPVESLVFDATGARAMVATLFGTVSHSDAPEAMWADAPAPAPGFGCLTRGPGDGNEALYACADAYQGASWTLARSEDFGRTWQPALTAFQTVTQRWACAADTPAALACADVCPGQMPGATCDADGGSGGTDAGPGREDAGADAAGGSRDAGAGGVDAQVVGAVGIQPGTCQAAPGRGRVEVALAAGLVCLAAARRRRRR